MKSIKDFARSFAGTPFHPQWLVLRNDRSRLEDVAACAHGKVLDIGCADQALLPFLNASHDYIGLDYPPTASALYQTQPTVFGNAAVLPFAENSFDTIVMLEVLEHLAEPEQAMQECHRVLKPGGKFILSVPFLYPIHDAPHDYQRLTLHGLRHLAAQTKWTITEEIILGSPLGSATLLANVAIAKTVVNAIGRTKAWLLLLPPVAIVIPLLNMLGYCFERFGPADGFMAQGYQLSLRKGQT